MPLASTATIAGVSPTLAGCGISVKSVNRDSKEATVYLYDSKSKVTYGHVREARQRDHQGPGERPEVDGHHLDLGRNYDRRSTSKVGESGEETTIIDRPSSTGWTRTTNLTVNIDF